MVQQVIFSSGTLGTRPFYRARLTREQLLALRDLLESVARDGQRWRTVAASGDRPERFRLEPDESNGERPRLSDLSLRGDVFRIRGVEGEWCHLELSPQGAGMLIERIDLALDRMQRWVELRLPSRKRSLVQFVTDADLESEASAEMEAVNEAALRAGAERYPPNEFADWKGYRK